jgi:hypothetical protein
MAVYQGARPRAGMLAPQPRAAGASTLPRRTMRGAVRARRGPNRIGLVLGGIVLAFLLAFFSLAQTVAVSATSYDIDRMGTERQRLEAIQRDLTSNLNRLGREPAIRKQAVDAGLGQLSAPHIIPAR